MNLHQHFEESLVWDPLFRKWVMTHDAELDAHWQQWIIDNPKRAKEVLVAKRIVQAIAVKEPDLSDEAIAENIEAIMAAVNEQELMLPDEKTAPVKRMTAGRYWWIAAAASVVIILFAWNVFYRGGVKAPKEIVYRELVKAQPKNELVEKINTSGKRTNVELPDGSIVTLENNSRISYPNHFSKRLSRKVFLSGDAIFEVTKDPSHPFIVYTNGLITKVLGTKFFVHAKDGDKKASVEVISGIVSVSSLVDNSPVDITIDDIPPSDKLNTIVITANQQASYTKTANKLVAGIVANPNLLPSHETSFRFQDSRVDSVISAIGKAYGIDIIYDEKSMANRTFTATLTTETMFEKIDILCKAMNARYELLDGKVILHTNAAY